MGDREKAKIVVFAKKFIQIVFQQDFANLTRILCNIAIY